MHITRFNYLIRQTSEAASLHGDVDGRCRCSLLTGLVQGGRWNESWSVGHGGGQRVVSGSKNGRTTRMRDLKVNGARRRSIKRKEMLNITSYDGHFSRCQPVIYSWAHRP